MDGQCTNHKMTVESVTEPSDGMYEVEKIVGMVKKKGEMQYKVRWKGYSSQYDTWEKEETLALCKDFIDQYKDQKRTKDKMAKQRRKEQCMKKTVTEYEKRKPSYSYAECTLKDTFWKDLEEGRVNVFATDLYSRVKASGRVAKDAAKNGGNIPDVDDDDDDASILCHEDGKKRRTSVRSRRTCSKKKKHKSAANASLRNITEISNSEIEFTEDSLSNRSCNLSFGRNDNVQRDCNHKKRVTEESKHSQLTRKRKLDSCSWSSHDSGIANPSPTSSEFSISESPRNDDQKKYDLHSFVVHRDSAKVDNASVGYVGESKRSLASTNAHVSSLSPEIKPSLLPPQSDVDVPYREEASLDCELDDVKTPESNAAPPDSSTLLLETPQLSPGEFKSAILRGDCGTVKRALEKQYSGKLETVDPTGMVLLMVAAQKGYDDIVDLLISHGSCVNAQQKNGTTALMLACEQGHLSTAAFLVEFGASINLQQTSGETALMKAVRRGHRNVVSFLLYKGANYNLRTASGNSAISLAKHLASTELESYLIQHRDRINDEFMRQVTAALDSTARLVSPVFPIQCFPLCDGPRFTITFSHDLTPDVPGIGYLLFVAHARISEYETTCRFYGPCAIKSASLNKVEQCPVSQNCGFVLSCCPLKDGRNDIVITTVTAPTSKTKLLICAYKAELATLKSSILEI